MVCYEDMISRCLKLFKLKQQDNKSLVQDNMLWWQINELLQQVIYVEGTR